MVDTASSPRDRDPTRKERILRAAAELVARNGFHAVSMAEIGATAGITGPAIYRHFSSKSSVLVALFDRVIDRLLAQANAIAHQESDTEMALVSLVEDQVDFVVTDRVLAQVYYTEINQLPEEDSRRLRRKQRLYLEEWVHLLCEGRQDLDEAEARTIVHASIGAVQSTLFHGIGLSDSRLRAVLTAAALRVLAGARAESDPAHNSATAAPVGE
jgi:AcrR family transcriptional regulator